MPEQEARGTVVPVRGTQSLVGVFQRVWKHPGLVALEVGWRWATAVPLLLLAGWAGAGRLRAVHLDWNALGAMTVFLPVQAVETLGEAGHALWPPVWFVLRWWAPLALLVWTAAGAYAQQGLWRRQDPALHRAGAAMFVLGLLRSLGLLVVLLLWSGALLGAAQLAVLAPARAGREPQVVLLAALGVAATLALFTGWSLVSWVLDAARLLAMRDGVGVRASLRAAVAAMALRSRLVELNLVMGIVRVALLVLATVASASPLPFASVETTQFLQIWWCFVAVAYLLASDLFQLVRRSAGLYLMHALESPQRAVLTPLHGQGGPG